MLAYLLHLPQLLLDKLSLLLLLMLFHLEKKFYNLQLHHLQLLHLHLLHLLLLNNLH
jgi:hypothetical protein